MSSRPCLAVSRVLILVVVSIAVVDAHAGDAYTDVFEREAARSRAEQIALEAEVTFLDELLAGDERNLVEFLFDDVQLDELKALEITSGMEAVELELEYGDQHPSVVAVRASWQRACSSQGERETLLLAGKRAELDIASTLASRLYEELGTRGVAEDPALTRAAMQAMEAEIRVRSIEVAIRHERLETLMQSGASEQAALQVDNRLVHALQSGLKVALAEEAELSARYGDKHPSMIHRRLVIETYQLNLTSALESALRVLQLREELYDAQMAALRTAQPE